jgi:hypothetical protein
MLLPPLMRPYLLLAVWSLAGLCSAQVRTTVSVAFTGAPDERRIDGIAEPAAHTSAITVDGSLRSGAYTWCQALLTGDSVRLTPSPAIGVLQDGTTVRFVAPAALSGPLGAKVPGHPGLALVRSDGLHLTPGQVPQGLVVEAIQAGGKLYVVNTWGGGCPPGFLAAHQNLCMEANSVSGLLFHQAITRCTDLGGKLCSWDEFIAGCNLLTGQLQNQFVDWEWVDDSSNHGHGADQVGRFTCESQRHFGLIATTPGRARCCLRPR